MRQIWILGDDSRAQTRLSTAFSDGTYGIKYEVRTFSSLSQISAENFQRQDLSFLLDAFCSEHPGFEGLKELRTLGFKGPVLLMGEPAPQDAHDPFLEQELTAFVPPVDRFDPELVAGIIHTVHEFQGEIDIKGFLQKGAKASIETIKDMGGFNQLALKLASFVVRLGIDVHKIKRVLVSMSSSHVKSVSGVPQLIAPFKIAYGLDSKKMVLAVSLVNKKTSTVELKNELIHALKNLKNDKSPKSHRSDLLNVSKLTNNIIYFGGSINSEDSNDHYILSAIPLVSTKDAAIEFYSFGFVWAKPFEESAAVEVDDEVVAIPTEVLFEPNIVGDHVPEDEPLTFAPVIESAIEQSIDNEASTDGIESIESASDSVAIAELEVKIQTLDLELKKEQKLAAALASDVKRLMKERRQPITEGDLKESLKELTLRFDRAQEQNKRMTEMLAQKETQIELLKAQVDRLKSTAA